MGTISSNPKAKELTTHASGSEMMICRSWVNQNPHSYFLLARQRQNQHFHQHSSGSALCNIRPASGSRQKRKESSRRRQQLSKSEGYGRGIRPTAAAMFWGGFGVVEALPGLSTQPFTAKAILQALTCRVLSWWDIPKSRGKTAHETVEPGSGEAGSQSFAQFRTVIILLLTAAAWS
ncbi:hypothetical protein C8034_v008961 [Colletotrichum sidae]|uniref:Uncharacterized protein n=1 Tax=Colletotrichum sidae TaxID=1347389 RepID=A0A4V3I3U5_9PEZI|nr:hypothetical protein C8034_v008961 [Colletotrichum sidae]